VFENAIDMAHIHYLHNDSFGNSEKPRIMDMATSRDTFHVEANFRWGAGAGAVGSCVCVHVKALHSKAEAQLIVEADAKRPHAVEGNMAHRTRRMAWLLVLSPSV
jgi:hypothetical protein